MDKKETARECRFVIHIPSRSSDTHDVHLIKEVIHYDDNTTEPNIRFVKDFKRPYWVTKPAFRTKKKLPSTEGSPGQFLKKELNISQVVFTAITM